MAPDAKLRISCLQSIFASARKLDRPFIVADFSESKNLPIDRLVNWLATLLEDPDEQTAFQAAIGLSRLGGDATPAILREFLTRTPAKRTLLSAYSYENTSCFPLFRPWALASLSLERIGAPAVERILEFVVANRGALSRSSSPPAADILSATTVGTSPPLYFLLRVLTKLDGQSLMSLYDHLPEDAPAVKQQVLDELFALDPELVAAFLTKHPNSIPAYLHRRAFLLRYNQDQSEHLQLGSDPANGLIAAAHSDDKSVAALAVGSLLELKLSATQEQTVGALTSVLKGPTNELSAYYSSLLLKNDISWLDDPKLFAVLQESETGIDIVRRLAAWKGLHDLGRSDLETLGLILETAYETISAGPEKGREIFDAVKVVLHAGGVPLPDDKRIRIMAEVASCPVPEVLGEVISSLINNRDTLQYPFAYAASARLVSCPSGGGYAYSASVYLNGRSADVAAGAEFWRTIIVHFKRADVVNLAYQAAPALKPELVEVVYGSLVQIMASSDSNLRGRLRDVSQFVHYLRIKLAQNSSDAARILFEQGLITPSDVQSATLRLLAATTKDDARRAASILAQFGQPGREAFRGLMSSSKLLVARLATEEVTRDASDLDLPSLREHTDNDDQEVRIESNVALLGLRDYVAVTTALRKHTDDLAVFIKRMLVADDREALNRSLVTFRESTASSSTPVLLKKQLIAACNRDSWLRTAVIRELKLDLLAQEQGKDRDINIWVLLGELGSDGEAFLLRSLSNACSEVRTAAFTGLVRAAQSKADHARVIALLSSGVPFVRPGIVITGGCAKSQPSRMERRRTAKSPNFVHVVSFSSSWSDSWTASEVEENLEESGTNNQTVVSRLVRALGRHVTPVKLDNATELFVSLMERLSSAHDPTVSDLLLSGVRKVLDSKCEECKKRTENLLNETTWGQRLVLSLGVERYGKAYANEEFGAFGTGCMTLESGKISVLPVFDFPAPSDKTELPVQFVAKWKTMGDSFEDLRKGMESAGYPRLGIFSVPDGYAVVTGLERMKSDGSVLPDGERWSFDNTKVETLGDYIARLFYGETGRYRMLAFVLSSTPPLITTSHLDASRANSLYLSGGFDLPDELAAKTMQGAHCYVLIYEYERNPGDVHQVVPASSPTISQLQRSGLVRTLHIPVNQ